jgi:ornithine carbamoyltransferase/carbamoyltransferase
MLTLASPPGYGLAECDLLSVRTAAERVDAKIIQAFSMDDLPHDVDIIYTTRWQTTGTRKTNPDWREVFRPFHINEKLMARWPTALFMHDLPAHRGDEVSGSVLDGNRSIVWNQAAMKLTSAMAILEWCMPHRVRSDTGGTACRTA